ncbi:hypothetical protein Cni_G08911 [Canna indica]|uniref:CCHC-type domain-containing protein n=1 Tax=Canna indica TaxID=4628 RepID=A0AAQ3K1J2_9LILI|nr:hypothetical protein Cni_G08911 [Canna indica]
MNTWASLFRRSDPDSNWRESKEVAEKINKIQNSAKGRIKIEEADLAEAKKGSELILYEKIDVIPVWVQLPGLPLEFLNSRIFLPQVAAAIGKPLRFDNVTQKGELGKFARICVMMNLKEPVQQGFWIDTDSGSFFQSIAYENMLFICFKCGRLGHDEKGCNKSDGSDAKEKKKNG